MKRALLLLVVMLPLCSFAKSKHVQLPDKLLSAHTVMLYGGPPQVLDKALSELNKWGRFTVVSDKSKADVIFEFIFIEKGDSGLLEQHESFVIYDSQTGDVLYQDARMAEPTGIFTLIPHSMAKQMIKELRKRIENK